MYTILHKGEKYSVPKEIFEKSFFGGLAAISGSSEICIDEIANDEILEALRNISVEARLDAKMRELYIVDKYHIDDKRLPQVGRSDLQSGTLTSEIVLLLQTKFSEHNEIAGYLSGIKNAGLQHHLSLEFLIRGKFFGKCSLNALLFCIQENYTILFPRLKSLYSFIPNQIPERFLEFMNLYESFSRTNTECLSKTKKQFKKLNFEKYPYLGYFFRFSYLRFREIKNFFLDLLASRIQYYFLYRANYLEHYKKYGEGKENLIEQIDIFFLSEITQVFEDSRIDLNARYSFEWEEYETITTPRYHRATQAYDKVIECRTSLIEITIGMELALRIEKVFQYLNKKFLPDASTLGRLLNVFLDDDIQSLLTCQRVKPLFAEAFSRPEKEIPRDGKYRTSRYTPDLGYEIHTVNGRLKFVSPTKCKGGLFGGECEVFLPYFDWKLVCHEEDEMWSAITPRTVWGLDRIIDFGREHIVLPEGYIGFSFHATGGLDVAEDGTHESFHEHDFEYTAADGTTHTIRNVLPRDIRF